MCCPLLLPLHTPYMAIDKVRQTVTKILSQLTHLYDIIPQKRMGVDTMPSFASAMMIRDMRYRKQMQQRMLQEDELGNTITRIEGGKHEPLHSTLSKTMDIMGMPVETYFYPYLENVSTDVFALRDHILYLLEQAEEQPLALEEAKKLTAKMQTMGNFSKGINRQMILSLQTRILALEGQDPAKIITLAIEGILETYPEYNQQTFDDNILLFEESTLKHSAAKALAIIDPPAAIQQLQKISAGIERLHGDDKDKERRLPPVMLDLAQLLAKTGDYPQALAVCEQGLEVSKRRNGGKHMPDFAYIKAIALEAQGWKKEAEELLMQAYYGFIAMRRPQKAAQVQAHAQKMGITLKTYGVENLPSKMPAVTFEYGKYIPATSVSSLIRNLRFDADIDQKTLYQGICSRAAFERFMRGETQGKVYHLEPFFQRFGRDLDKYLDTFLSRDEFAGKQLRDKAFTLTANGRYEEAQICLDQLKKRKDFKKDINLQFVKMEEATIHSGLVGRDAKHMELLKQAWAITMGGLDPMNDYAIAQTRLTHNEIIIVNQIAINMCKNGEIYKGACLLKSLMESMDRFYVDDSEKKRMYPTLMYNYNNQQESLNWNQETLDFAIKGEELCLKYSNLTLMPGFMSNRGCALFKLNEKEKSLPYLVVAHYVAALLGDTRDKASIRNYVKENFDIGLD